MTPLQLRGLSRAVLGGFLIGSSLIGNAQENNQPGMVRITDSRPRGVPIRNASNHAVGKGEYHNVGHSSHYGSTYGDCPECYDDCDDGHKKGKHKHCFREHYCKHSPDHGYVTPGKVPIYRYGVQYNQYYPAGWYGTANGGITGPVFPMIYQPTDTTQLGYYYQHVPFWMPNPNALPPRPIPAQWHRRVAAANMPWHHGGWGHGGWGHGHRYGDAYCPPGSGWVETPTTTPTPIQAQPAPLENPPADDPGANPPVPPVDDSALNLHIRRAALEQ